MLATQSDTRDNLVEALRSATSLMLAADDAWSASLRRAFGKSATVRRYDWDQSAHPAECQTFLAVKLAADQAMFTAFYAVNAFDAQ